MGEFTLADRKFSSKGHAEQYVRGIMDGACIGKPLTGDATERVIAWLSQVHYDWDRKRGPGITAITVRMNAPNARGFWLCRVNGTETDISYKPYNHSQRFNVMKAFRSEIMYQVVQFRDEVEWPIKCPMTGKTIGSDEAHIHHAWPWPFSKIVESFMKEEGLTFDDVRTRSAIGETTRWIVDQEIKDAFIRYHMGKAKLQAVDAEWNIRAGNESYE